jgi:energy-converting hydrogenase Eha subunit F
MRAYTSVLFALSAAVVALLGLVHLYYTLASNKFYPRDVDLKERLESVSPVLTGKTTMWKAWVGFNISHSLGALLFGVIYGYLGMFRLAVLQGSLFLLIAGAFLLIAYLILGKVYWSSTPFRGIGLAFVLYVTGLTFALVTR